MKYTVCNNILCDRYKACRVDKPSLSRATKDIYRLNCPSRKRYNRLVKAKRTLEVHGQTYTSILPDVWDSEHDKFHNRNQEK